MRLQLSCILLCRDRLLFLLAKDLLANHRACNAMALGVAIAVNGLVATKVARSQSCLLLHVKHGLAVLLSHALTNVDIG